MKALPKIPKNPVCHDMQDVNTLVLALVEFQTAKKAIETIMDECKDAIKAFMKEHEVTSVSTKETYASITKYSTTKFDKKAFEAEHPKMYKKYTITTSQERFTYGKEDNDNA